MRALEETGEGGADFLAERISILILLQLPSAWPTQHWASAEAYAQWLALMDLTGHTIVAAEVGTGGRPLIGCFRFTCSLISVRSMPVVWWTVRTVSVCNLIFLLEIENVY